MHLQRNPSRCLYCTCKEILRGVCIASAKKSFPMFVLYLQRNPSRCLYWMYLMTELIQCQWQSFIKHSVLARTNVLLFDHKITLEAVPGINQYCANDNVFVFWLKETTWSKLQSKQALTSNINIFIYWLRAYLSNVNWSGKHY